jgi:hypothetical protein
VCDMALGLLNAHGPGVDSSQIMTIARGVVRGTIRALRTRCCRWAFAGKRAMGVGTTRTARLARAVGCSRVQGRSLYGHHHVSPALKGTRVPLPTLRRAKWPVDEPRLVTAHLLMQVEQRFALRVAQREAEVIADADLSFVGKA